MNMSFSLTTEQYRNRTKTVTRRIGWHNAKVNQVCRAVEKAQGLRKGEHQVQLGFHKWISLRWERLDKMLTDPEYGRGEVIKEGFPEMTPAEFVEMFCKANKCTPSTKVHRMEFEYL